MDPRLVLVMTLALEVSCASRGASESAPSSSTGTPARPAGSAAAAPSPAAPAGPHVRVVVSASGYVVSLEGRATDVACARPGAPPIARDAAGELDGAALRRCLTDVDRSSGGLASPVLLSATAETPYHALVTAMETIQSVFPSIVFGAPPGITAGYVPSSNQPTGAQDEGAVVMVTKTELRFADADRPVVTFDVGSRSAGAPAMSKDPMDPLVIAPLAARMRSWVADDAKIRAATGKQEGGGAVVVADESTPYRLLFEVLHTLDRSGCTGFHFLVRTGAAR